MAVYIMAGFLNSLRNPIISIFDLIRNRACIMSDFDVSLAEFQQLLQDPRVLVIDVREPNELEETGVIPGTINIPRTLEATLGTTNETFRNRYNCDKPQFDDLIVFTCRSGRRSLLAIDATTKLGFTNVKHFPGGWLEWHQHH